MCIRDRSWGPAPAPACTAPIWEACGQEGEASSSRPLRVPRGGDRRLGAPGDPGEPGAHPGRQRGVEAGQVLVAAEAEDDVELRLVVEIARILFGEPGRDALRVGFAAGHFQQLGADVDADHVEAPAGQLDAAPADRAGEVEDALVTLEPQYLHGEPRTLLSPLLEMQRAEVGGKAGAIPVGWRSRSHSNKTSLIPVSYTHL